MRSFLLVKVFFTGGREVFVSPPFLDLFGKLLVFASLGATMLTPSQRNGWKTSALDKDNFQQHFQHFQVYIIFEIQTFLRFKIPWFLPYVGKVLSCCL